MTSRCAAIRFLAWACAAPAVAAAGPAHGPAAARRPAVLFCSPQGPDQVPSGDDVDLGYLAQLHAQGFEVSRGPY